MLFGLKISLLMPSLRQYTLPMKWIQLDRQTPVEEIGGKARGLVELMCLGANVPKAFLIQFESADDFQKFLIDPGQQQAVLESISPQLSSRLIVRSSAPMEDGEKYSFAGIFESFKCTNTLSSIQEAILQCSKSMTDLKAEAYATSFGFKIPYIQLIIQDHISASFSGVFFKVGARGAERYVFDTTSGDCSNVVSGAVNSFTGVIDGTNIHILNEGEDQGNLAANWVDIRSQLLQLKEFCHEKYINKERDIEWLIDGKNALWFLQSRPVTKAPPIVELPATVEQTSLGLSQAVCTDVNLRENYPNPVKPLLMSIAKESYRNYFSALGGVLGLNNRLFSIDTHLRASVVNIRGRIYYNMSAISHIISILPFSHFVENAFDQFIGYSVSRVKSPIVLLSFIRDSFRLSKICFRFLFALRKSRSGVKSFAIEVERLFQKVENNELTLKQRFHEFLRFRFQLWSPLAVSDLSAMLSFSSLNVLSQLWAPKFFKEGRISFLLMGLDNVISTETSQDLNIIAGLIRADKKALLLFESSTPIQILQSVHSFREIEWKISAYISKWGFRFSEELTLDEPSFTEKPENLIEMIQGVLRAKNQKSPEEMLGELRGKSRTAWDDLEKEVKTFWKISILRTTLSWTKESIRYRELSRTQQAKLYGFLRQTILLIGDQLVDQGLMFLREDVLFLTYMEIQDLLNHQFSFPQSLIEQVQIRKKHYRNLSTERPRAKQVIAENRLTDSIVDFEKRETLRPEFLEGQIACSGVIEGKIVALKSVKDIGQVSAGDILVTGQTDPGWGPVFPLISGLIIEHGGLLSHGAILAREFGIPCLVGVEQAGASLRTGDRVQLDARCGKISVISRLEII
jgi:pyruvate,water dikinase